MISKREFSADRMARARMLAEREAFEKGIISGAANIAGNAVQGVKNWGKNVAADVKANNAIRREKTAAGDDERLFNAQTPEAQGLNPDYVSEQADKRARAANDAGDVALGGSPAPAPAAPAPAPAAPAPAAGAPAPAAGGAAPAAPAPAAGAAPANNMQQMAQNMAFGADAQAIQAGKGGDKQSWMKDRSLGGKFADVLSMGLTAGMGSTGLTARNQANKKNEAQTQRYNQAQNNMQQRFMGGTVANPMFGKAQQSANRIHSSIEHIMLRKQMRR